MSLYYNLFVQKLDALVNDNKSLVAPYFEKGEKLTGVKRTYLAQALLGVLSLYLIVGKAAQFVCNLIGFVYPAYKSLVALESSNKEDDTKWLTYWVVFAAFSVVEFFSDSLMNWFPFYWLAKVVFLLWCSADIPTNGSTMMYHRFIRPLFLQHKNKLQQATNGSPGKTTAKDN